MSLVKLSSGKIFHELFRDCISKGRIPTDAEVDLVAEEIWRSSYGVMSGQPWRAVAEGSDAHRQMINAALAALGAHTKQLKPCNDEGTLVSSA